MKKTLAVLFAGLLIAMATPAMAIYVTMQPADKNVAVGEEFGIQLKAFLEPGEYLDWYDIDVSFQDGILNYTGYELGTGLGNDTEDMSTDRGVAGIANVAQYSWEPDMGFQSGNIMLATLMFEAEAIGYSRLGYDYFQLAFGTHEYELDVDLSGTGADINVVPIPGAVWLLGTGLVGLAGLRRKMKK